MAEQFEEGWYFNSAECYDMVMMEPGAGQLPHQMSSAEYAQSVPYWLPHWSLCHEGQALQWCPEAQGGYDCEELIHQHVDPASFSVQDTYGVLMDPSFVEVQPHIDYPWINDHVPVAMLTTPGPHLSVCHSIITSPAADYPSEEHLIDILPNNDQVHTTAYFTNPSMYVFGGQSLPEATSLEDDMRFLWCEPGAEITEMSQVFVESESRELTAAHDSEQQLMFNLCNKPQVPALTHLSNPGLQGFGHTSVLQDQSFSEVTSLEDATRFFQCGPEAEIAEKSQTPVEPEFRGLITVMGSHIGHHITPD